MKIASLYQQVTNAIIADLEMGAPIWVRPWKTTRRTILGFLPANLATRRTYSGINIPILWRAASEGGYADHAWMTFKQALGFDARVRKGEKATFIVFTKKLLVQEDDEERRISMLRSYAVFNVAQIEGLPPQLAQPRGDFSSVESYRATLLHELGHWSAHEKRLNRDLKSRFGSQAYAAEELVAELTSAFLCAHLGIAGELRHASYIDTWIALLKEDNRAIFTAASKASQAADFLRSFSAEVQQVEECDA